LQYYIVIAVFFVFRVVSVGHFEATYCANRF